MNDNTPSFLKRLYLFFKVRYDGRIMPCYFVGRLGKIPFIGKYIKSVLQFLCGKLCGHCYDADWGYGGEETIDVWCRYCNYYTQLQKTSIWFRNKESRKLMDQVGKSFDQF